MKITDVSTQKNNPMRVSVFVDGEYKFSLDAADAALKGIRPGRELSQKEIDNLILDGDFAKARDYALSVLSRKAVSAKMLGDKLREKGYTPIVIPEVIRDLEDMGYIDDEAYGRMFLEYCTEKLWGRRKIRFEMSAGGIPDDIIEELMTEFESESPIESMVELIHTKYRGEDLGDMKVRSRIMRYFASRGFDFSTVDTAIKRAITENDNE